MNRMPLNNGWRWLALLAALAWCALAGAQTHEVATATQLRATPSLNSTVVQQLPIGAPLQAVQTQGGWLKVQSGQQQGWVRISHVKSMTAARPTPATGGGNALASLFTGSSSAPTATTGARGLTQEQLANAQPAPHAVNAYATPGGYVFVTKGLLRTLNSEAELAGVLGHEITHVVHGHYLSAVKKGGFAQIAGGIVETRSGNSQLSGAMINMVRNIYAKGLDQSDEYDADRYGTLWAARAGYAPAGLMQSLRVVAGGSAQDANYQLLLATHPPAQSRITKLEPLMSSKFSGVAGATNEQRYLAMRRVLR